jgi:replicative DNA helicase
MVPYAVDAERALIGLALLYPNVWHEASTLVEPSDFSLRNGHIWHAIGLAGSLTDPVSVAGILAAEGHHGDDYSAAALNTYWVDTPARTGVLRYAQTVHDTKVRQQIVEAAGEMMRVANDEHDASRAIDASQSFLDRIDLRTAVVSPPPTGDEFLASTPTTYDWLIPDFLERTERFMLTGGEGSGKSVLLFQMALMASQGLHPWTLAPIPPMNVTLVDLENNSRLVARRYAEMKYAATVRLGRQTPRREFDGSRFRILSLPSGVDVLRRSDRKMLLGKLLSHRTDLVALGPMYRLVAGAPDKGDAGGENQAREIAKALDEIRFTCDAAMLVELHSAHASGKVRDLRPIGSSMWLRWPEFGVGLRSDVEDEDKFTLEDWRGGRDRLTRRFPSRLFRVGHLPSNQRDFPWQTRMEN